MGTNRPRSLALRHAGVGLDPGSGGTLDVDLNELTAATVDVAADSIPIIDATDDGSKKEAIADLVDAIAGEGIGAVGGVMWVDLDEHGDAVLDPAADTIPFIDESAAGDPTKLESVADLVTAIAGSAASTGLVAAAGVLTVTPSDAAINVATDSIQFVTAAGLPKKEAAADLATAMADNVGIAAAAGVLSLKDGGVVLAKLAATLLKGVTTVPMSFETGEQAATKIYFPYKVTINKIRGIVTKAIADTTNGTVQGANTDGNSATGLLTAVALDALNTEYAVSPTTNNTVLADGFYKLTSAKADAGGKVLVTLEWTRTA